MHDLGKKAYVMQNF